MKEYSLGDRTIGRILAEKAERIPDHPWLLWQDERHTFADLEAMTNRFANGLAELGIARGDHVAVLLGNGPEFFWTIWGLGKLGAVAVPVNTAAKGELLRYFIDQSDSQWIVVDEESAQRVAAIADKVPRVRGVLHHGPKAPASCGIVSPSVPVLALGELARASGARPPIDAVRHDDLHLIMYTSGTTGPSKGVMSPHSQGHGVGWSLAKFFGYRSDDVIYTCLPLFHGNALWYSAYAALWAEAALAVAPRFSATQFWDDIRRFGATQFNTLGAMTNILWKLPPSPADHEHRLRLCMTVPVPKEIYQELQQRYHVQITSVYAMTENCAVTLFTPDDPPAKAGAAGKTRGYAEIRIVDDDGRECAAGETGEIAMRAAPGMMMMGYYKMPEATAQQFRDGWFQTGDRGYVDADGYLYFADRKKEAIRRRGENISAYEVELILSRHPQVLEVAAIPVSSELTEDDVMVYVVLKAGERLSEKEIVEFCNEHMAYYMVPRFVAFIDALPKTPSEKIEKYKLKRDAEARREELWDREQHGIVVRR